MRIKSSFIICLASTILLPVSGFAKSSDPFEIVIIPDSQKFSRVIKTGAPDLFLMQTKWIKKHAKSENIVFVSHVGDVIENNTKQWPHAAKVMDQIHGVVPYSVTFGNHDHGAPSVFNAKRYQGMPWYLGASPDSMAHAQIFTGGDMKFLHINLPYNPKNPHFKWAKSIISKHPHLPTIISTHGYMADNSWGRSDIGQRIWKDLVEPNEQVFMTLNGHDWVSRHELGITKSGRKVIQLQANWQEIINGGNALLQKVIFEPKKNQISVKSYSPFLDLYHTDWTGEFAFSVTFSDKKITVNREITPPHQVWDSKSSNNHWSLKENWNGAVPKANDILRFPKCKQLVSVNDLPSGTHFAGIIFEPGKFSGGYQLSGNLITLTGDIVNMGTYGPKKPQTGPTINFPICLKGDRQINTGDWDMTINGVISGSGSLTKTHGRDYIRGSYDGHVYLGDLYLTRVNTYTGNTRVTGGALILNNDKSSNLIPSSPSIYLHLNAVLKATGLKDGTLTLSKKQSLLGTGLFIGNLVVPQGAHIAPGIKNDDTGTLHQKGNLTITQGGILDLQFKGNHPNEYDRLSVKGAVSIQGAKLHLSKIGNFSPKAGDVFQIIENDGNDPVQGQFISMSGTVLSEGAEVKTNFLNKGLHAKISYRGGDGNDVILTIF